MNLLHSVIARALRVQSVWLVAACVFAWLAVASWTRPLISPDEGRYVGVAWNMLGAGEWLTPLLNGLPFFHKPPLFYWITAFALKLFGVNEWAGRFSSALGATVMAAMLFWFLKRYTHGRLAGLAVLVLALQPFLFGGAHYANLDMTVAGIISATIFLGAAAVLHLESGKPYRGLLALAYVLAGLGFLAKGLIGVVLPGAVLLFWMLGRRQFSSVQRVLWLPGIALFLLICLPWMLYMQARYPGFVDYYIVYQHFQRFVQGGFNNPHPFWFYVPVLLVLTLPWSIQLWRVCRRSFWCTGGPDPVRSLMVWWLVVIVGFFSIPTSKLIGYVLPALAPLAYFVARAFHDRLQGEAADKALRTLSWSFLVAVIICLAAVVAMVVKPQPSSKGLAKKMLADYGTHDYVVMLDYLRYDLNFYLGTVKPAIVVADWAASDIAYTDNWRKELYDAAAFNPGLGEQLLINRDGFPDFLCRPHDARLWLVADRAAVANYPLLKGLQPFAEDGRLVVWRIEPGVTQPFCAEMPRTGLK